MKNIKCKKCKERKHPNFDNYYCCNQNHKDSLNGAKCEVFFLKKNSPPPLKVANCGSFFCFNLKILNHKRFDKYILEF